MYEYSNDNYGRQSEESVINQAVLVEQEKARKKAEKKAKRKSFLGKMLVSLLVGMIFGIAGGVCFSGVVRVIDLVFPRVVVEESSDSKEDNKKEKEPVGITKSFDEDSKDKAEAKKERAQSTDVDAVMGMGVSDLVKESMPSIVSITNKSVQEVRSMFGMGVREYESTSAGSGIIIAEDDVELLIATNDHVVEGAKSLTVGFVDDEVYTAYVKGTDPDIDLAVVAVKLEDLSDSTKDAIQVAVVGDSDKLSVGEQVVAIGNALGYGQSVTTGIVSALNRDVTDDDIDNPLIQTDAAINPGNSGGALFNMKGELIGINCAKIASTSIEGVGYAIPTSEATPIIETLMNRKTREEIDAKDAGYIGISGVSVDASTSEMYGIPQGIFIQNVEEKSPADEAGLIKGDVLRKFDGITVNSIAEVRENLNYYKSGETVDLLIYRQVDGEYLEKNISITLGSRKGTALDPDASENVEEKDSKSEEQDREEKEESDNGIYFEYGNDFDDFFNMFP